MGPSEEKGGGSGQGASTQGISGPSGPLASESATHETPPPDSAPEGPAKEVTQALHEAFNKPGRTGISDVRPESGYVWNPKERRKRTRENYAARKSQEPVNPERITRRMIDVWDPKNKAIRDFLYEEYAGRCQICGEANRFPRRDGKAYFEAVYLVPHTEAAWTDEPGSVICLCALCSAKFQHGAVRCENVAAQMRALKTIAEGGHGKPVVNIELVGKQVGITFSERHLIEVQELLAVADPQGGPATPGTPPSGGVMPSSPSPAPSPSRPPTANTPGESRQRLVPCPECHPKVVLVRPDNLEQHIARVHMRSNQVALTRQRESRGQAANVQKRPRGIVGPYTLPRPAKDSENVRRCRACGSPVVPGEDYCYSHL